MKFETYKNLKTEYFYLKPNPRTEVQICAPIVNKTPVYSKSQIFLVKDGQYTQCYCANSLDEAKVFATLIYKEEIDKTAQKYFSFINDHMLNAEILNDFILFAESNLDHLDRAQQYNEILQLLLDLKDCLSDKGE